MWRCRIKLRILNIYKYTMAQQSLKISPHLHLSKGPLHRSPWQTRLIHVHVQRATFAFYGILKVFDKSKHIIPYKTIKDNKSKFLLSHCIILLILFGWQSKDPKMRSYKSVFPSSGSLWLFGYIFSRLLWQTRVIVVCQVANSQCTYQGYLRLLYFT